MGRIMASCAEGLALGAARVDSSQKLRASWFLQNASQNLVLAICTGSPTITDVVPLIFPMQFWFAMSLSAPNHHCNA